MSRGTGKTAWILWPFVAVWRLIALIIQITGRLLAVVLGVVLIIVGLLISLTIIGAVLGIPLMIVGILLVVRGLF